MTIKELCTAAYTLAKEKGWYQPPRTTVESICLVHAELSEAVEEVRKDSPPVYVGEDGKPEGVVIELADAVIRIADLCEANGWNLEAAIEIKHLYNQSRSFRHGGKKL